MPQASFFVLPSALQTLQQVGEVLGHQDSRTNAPYAHFMSGPRLELADKTAITLRAYLEKQTRT